MKPITSIHTEKAAENAVDVLLICALKDEYDQVCQVSDGIIGTGWYEHSNLKGWIVADARFSTASGNQLFIRATHASHMGREQVQALASRLIEAQPARCIAMTGICAGRRGKVALGDVIFADCLWSYDNGKTTEENGIERFYGDPIQYRPPPNLVQRMQHIAKPNAPWLQLRPFLPLEFQEEWLLLRIFANDDLSDDDAIREACPDWNDVLDRLWNQRGWLKQDSLELTPDGIKRANNLRLRYRINSPTPPDFKTHVAPIATGAAVTEDAGIFPRLAKSMRKVLGVEMEASALGALGAIHNIPVLVAKGVSDYGDSLKDDRYRHFAARASAECMIALLRNSDDLLLNRRSYHRAESSRKNPPFDTTGNGLFNMQTSLEQARTLLEKLFKSPPEGIDLQATSIASLPPELLNRQTAVGDILECLLDRPKSLLGLLNALAEKLKNHSILAELNAARRAISEDFGLDETIKQTQIQQTADNGLPALLIEISEAAPPGIRCNVQVRLFQPGGLVNCVDVRELNICDPLEQNNFVDDLRAILVRKNIDKDQVIIEFALPITLLCHDIDHWADHAEEPLGTQFPVVLRSLERLYNPSWQLEWPKHWKALEAKFNTKLDKKNFKAHLHWPKDKSDIQGKLSTGVCIALDSVPDPQAVHVHNLLFYLAYKGAPAAIWARRDEGLSKLRTEIKKHLFNKPFGQLPSIFRDVRRQLYSTRKNDSVCYHLSLLWDDPTHVPAPKENDGDFLLAPT